MKLALLALPLAAGGAWLMVGETPGAAQTTPYVNAQVAVCFSPNGNCAAQIANAIDGARHEVRMQALMLSNKQIMESMIAARRRGVDVQVILDPNHAEDAAEAVCRGDKKNTPGGIMTAAGVPVFIDHPVKTAHNKVIIIDRELVIGGSFNYTQAANVKNAENATFTRSPQITNLYLQNWNDRRRFSTPFATTPC